MRGRHNSSVWADAAAVDTLARMWTKEGRSASEIARHLSEGHGRPVTRNAVIGKIAKLGWFRSANPSAPSKAPPPAPAAPRRPSAPERPAPPPVVASERPQPKIVRPGLVALPAPAASLALVELAPRQCRYAVTPDQARTHLFCGGPTEEGRPYCAAHAAIAYRPVLPRATAPTADRAGSNATGAMRRFR